MSIALQDEHAKLLQFMYACPVGLLELAIDGSITMVNPLAMQLLLPFFEKQKMGNFFDTLEKFAPELRNLTDAFTPIQGTVCEGHRVFVSPGSKKDGFEAQVLACTIVKLADSRYIVSLADISKQVAQESRLKQAETWFASLLDSVNDFAVISLDSEGLIESITPSVIRQTGYSEFQILGRSLDIFNVDEPVSGSLNISDQIALACRDGWHLYECWQSRREEPPYWCQRLIAVRSELQEGQERIISGYTVVLRDVTQQNSDTVKLTQMLRTDYLTGAYNRSYFFEVAGRECTRAKRYGQSLALVAIDLDHFKSVNDMYGHSTGDAVLKAFAEACSPLLRPNDTFARIGGEEFVLLLPSTDLAGAAQLAERLRQTIHATAIAVNGQTLTVTASMGCAEIQDKVSTVTELLAVADDALYRAKKMGRDQVALSVRTNRTLGIS